MKKRELTWEPDLVDEPVFTDEEIIDMYQRHYGDLDHYVDGPAPYIGRLTREQFEMVEELSRETRKKFEEYRQKILNNGR